MATAAQIAANIANSKKSCGPKTPEGKARARDNALKHGLFAATLLIKGEDPEEYNALVDDLIEQFDPLGTIENLLLSRMSACHWQSRRATINLSKQFESGGSRITESRSRSRYAARPPPTAASTAHSTNFAKHRKNAI